MGDGERESFRPSAANKSMERSEALHTFVMPYPASVLSGIRSMILAPEDMKMNLAPLGMSGTQAWKRARDPRVYQGVSEQDAWCEILERWTMGETRLVEGWQQLHAWTGERVDGWTVGRLDGR
jgi:hypothetical protein